MVKNITISVLVGLVVVLGLVVYLRPQPDSLGGLTSLDSLNLTPVGTEDALQVSGSRMINSSGVYKGEINPTTTTTLSAGFIWNTTSTGVIIRALNGSCYLIGLNEAVTSFTTSTRVCTD